MMLPWKDEVVPSVAEVPTCQKTLLAKAPPLRMTWRPAVVVSVDAIWKIQTPLPESVRSPDDIASEEVDLYRPGARVCPPILPATVIGAVERPAASLYAVVRQSLALFARVSLTCMAPPVTVPGGKPVTADPGLKPRSPLRMVGPVLVTVEPARIAKPAAQSRFTSAGPGDGSAAAVVKVQGLGTPPLAKALPARSVAAFEINAV